MIPNSLPFVVDSYSTGHFIYIVNLKNIIFNIILIIETRIYRYFNDWIENLENNNKNLVSFHLVSCLEKNP